MVRVSCTICLEDNLDVSALRNLPCGHAFCEPCITGHIETITRRRGPKPSCPQCRTGPIAKKDLRPVFIQFADGLSASQAPSDDATEDGTAGEALRKQLRHVKKGLDKLGPEVSIKSVETAAEKIETFRGVDSVPVLQQLVVVVASWFNTTGVPVFTTILEQREHISELEATIESATFAHEVELDKLHKTIKGLQDENTRMHNYKRDVEKREAAARAQASELARVRREKDEQVKKVAELETRRDELDKMLQVSSAKYRKRKAEVQRLQDQVSALRKELDARQVPLLDSNYDQEESLRVVDYSYRDDVEESPRLQKRRRLSDFTNSSPIRGSSSSPPPRVKVNFSHIPSSPVPQPLGTNFKSDWTVPHQTKKKLSFRESPKKTIPSPFSDMIYPNGRPMAKANFDLGSRKRLGKNG